MSYYLKRIKNNYNEVLLVQTIIKEFNIGTVHESYDINIKVGTIDIDGNFTFYKNNKFKKCKTKLDFIMMHKFNKKIEILKGKAKRMLSQTS